MICPFECESCEFADECIYDDECVGEEELL